MSVQSIGSPTPPALQVSTLDGHSVPLATRQPAISQVIRGTQPSFPENPVDPPPHRSVDRKEVENAVSRIKDFIQPINDSIQFSLDDETGMTLVKVIDLETKEVLRQIPSEEALNIAKALDKLQGLLIHNKA